MEIAITGNDTGHRWLRAGGDACDGKGLRRINMHVDDNEPDGLTVEVDVPPAGAWSVLLTEA